MNIHSVKEKKMIKHPFYTITTTPDPTIGTLGYIDADNNNAFVEVNVGNNLTIDQLRSLHLLSAQDGFGETDFSFSVSDFAESSASAPYISGTPSFNSSDNCIYLSFSGGMLNTSVDESLIDRLSL